MRLAFKALCRSSSYLLCRNWVHYPSRSTMVSTDDENFSFHTDISTMPTPSTIHLQLLITIRLCSIISCTMLCKVYCTFSSAQVKGLILYEVWFISYINLYTRVKTKPLQAKAMILASVHQMPDIKQLNAEQWNDCSMGNMIIACQMCRHKMSPPEA